MDANSFTEADKQFIEQLLNTYIALFVRVRHDNRGGKQSGLDIPQNKGGNEYGST